MTEYSGVIEGGDPHERACRLAGALAECCITGLTLEHGGETETLAARRDALPQALRALPVLLHSSAPRAAFLVEPNRITWRTGYAALAARLERC